MKGNSLAYISLIFICIIWGTTYLALRIGVMHYPPFLFAGIRQVISGSVIMLVAYLLSRKIDISRANILRQMFAGFLMITLGNGLVTWAEIYVPSGVAALLCSLMPVCAVFINLASGKKETLNFQIIAGLILGLGGVGLIFKDNISDLTNSSYIYGIAAIMVATFSWAYGSIINKNNGKLLNPIFNSGLQLLAGGAFLLIMSPFFDDFDHFKFYDPEGLLSMAYLIVFGSILAYTAYVYTLHKLPVGLVTIYAYINPLVAVILGYFILHEKLTSYTFLAFVTIIVGVFLVKKGYQKVEAGIAKNSDKNL